MLIDFADAQAEVPGLLDTDEDKVLVVIGQVDASIARVIGLPPVTAGGKPTCSEATYTRILKPPLAGSDRRRIRLGLAPVASVTSIHDSYDQEWDDDSLVDPSEYSLDGHTGSVWLKPGSSHAWSVAPRSIRAVFVAGFDDDAPPDDLQAAFLHAFRDFWTRRHVPSLPNAATVEQPPMVLSEDVRRMISPFVLWHRFVG